MRLLCQLLFWLLVSPIALAAQSIHYNYDALGRLVSVVDPNGNVASYVYDSNGNILSIKRYTSTQTVVLSFSPDSGPAGAVVTITGANFGADAAHNSVAFNGVAATVQSATATQIVAVVPAGATTGPISVAATAGSATSPNQFQVLPHGIGAPTIVGIDPSTAPPGTTVLLTGTNFETQSSNDIVSVNGYKAPVTTVNSSSSLAVSVPSQFGSGHVKLQTPYGSAVSSGDLYVPPSPYVSSQVNFTQRVASGVATTVSTTAAGNLGMLLIDGVAGQRASVVLANSTFPGCIAAIISVLGPDGSQLASTSTCGSSGFIDSFTLPSAGTYAVVIATPGGGGSALATVFLYNDLTSSIVANQSQSFTTTAPGQNARFTFIGNAGQNVNAWLTNSTYSGCLSTAITVLNPDGSQLATNSACGSSNVGLAVLTLPTTGTYTLIADPQGANTGSGTVTLSTDQQGTIGVDTSIPINITIPGQNARYTLTGTVGEQVNVGLTNSTFSGCIAVFVSILNPDGSELSSDLACGSGNVDAPSVSLPATGTYTIIVSPAGGGVGAGTLTLSTDQIASISVGNTVPVNITIPGQNARLTFDGTVGQEVNVALTNSTFSGCFAVVVTLLKPDGSQLASNYACYGNNVDIAEVTLPVSGTYTIVIATQNAGIGSGSVTLSTDQTGTIAMETSLPVSIITPGQNARYTFNALASQQITGTLTHSTFTGCYAVVVTILNPDQSQLTSSYACYSGDVNVPSVTLPTSGTYIVIVAPQNAGTGSGTLLIHSVGSAAAAPVFSPAPGSYSSAQAVTISDATPNSSIYYTLDGTAPTSSSSLYTGPLSVTSNQTINAIASAASYSSSPVATASYAIASSGAGTGTLSPGNSVFVSITSANQTAQYTFSGTTGQQVNVALTNSTFSGCYSVIVSVLNPDGSQLSSSGVCGTSSVDLAGLTLPQSGAYTIVVTPQNGGTGSGTLTLSTDQQAAITLGNSAPVSISIAGQNARYTFSGTTGQQVNVALTNSTFSGCYSLVVSILNPDGSQLSSTGVCGTSSVDFAGLILPQSGTYTIVVAPQSGGTGSGNLTLSTDQQATITPGTSATVNISIAGQNARYTFSGAAGDGVEVALTNSTFGGCYSLIVSVLNPDGSQLSSSAVCGTSSIDLSGLTLPQSGTYTIVVAPQNGGTGSGTLTLTGS